MNLLEPVDLEKESQFNTLEDLISKFQNNKQKKPVLQKQVTKEEEHLQNELDTQINTLQQLKAIFLEFIENATINKKTKGDFMDMLTEMKDLYNRIIGNKMYTNKNEGIDEVSFVLDVCNRYKDKLQSLQEYVQRGGKWETALSKGIEEGLGRSSFGDNQFNSKKSSNTEKNGLRGSKLQTSELVKFNTNSNHQNTDKKSKMRSKGEYNNPFDNSSFEEPKLANTMEKSHDNIKDRSSSFKHLERDDSAHTMEELRHFIIKEKGELENEIVSLKMKLEKRDQENLELKLVNERNLTKMKSIQNENINLRKQVKELKEEIYARILNITMTSNRTGSHSVNKFDSSSKINYKNKYKGIKKNSPKRRSTSFLSKPEDRIEKTKKEPERFDTNKSSKRLLERSKLDKKSLTNSKAFLQDFNKEISNILNRTSKVKNDDSGGIKRHGSQKRLYRGTETKSNYLDNLESKLGNYTATKGSRTNIANNDIDILKSKWDRGTGLNDFTGGLMKTKSQQFLNKDLSTPDYGDMRGTLQYNPANRLKYTLNMGDQTNYGVHGQSMNEFENYNVRANRLDNRPHSMANHDHIYSRHQMELGLMNDTDPRYPSKFDDIGNFKGSMYAQENPYTVGLDMNVNRGNDLGGTQMDRGGNGAFDAAKKLERYKNQMKMKHGEGGYGGRFY
jgi:hypothetical protein